MLDKEENGGSLAAGAAKLDAANLSAAQDEVSRLRVQYGTLHNLSLRREDRLAKLEEELRLVQKEATDTRAEVRKAAERMARFKATTERLRVMDERADEQCEYALTLSMMLQRLLEAKGGGEDAVNSLRGQTAELELRTQRQLAANGEVVHAAWQAKNGSLLQTELVIGQQRTRRLLDRQRQDVLKRAKDAVSAVSEEMLDVRQQIAQRARMEEAEEDVQLGVQQMQANQVAGHLRRLEAQFKKLQERIGHAEIGRAHV